jgi:hypothetical protein
MNGLTLVDLLEELLFRMPSNRDRLLDARALSPGGLILCSIAGREMDQSGTDDNSTKI